MIYWVVYLFSRYLSDKMVIRQNMHLTDHWSSKIWCICYACCFLFYSKFKGTKKIVCAHFWWICIFKWWCICIVVRIEKKKRKQKFQSYNLECKISYAKIVYYWPDPEKKSLKHHQDFRAVCRRFDQNKSLMRWFVNFLEFLAQLDFTILMCKDVFIDSTIWKIYVQYFVQYVKTRKHFSIFPIVIWWYRSYPNQIAGQNLWYYCGSVVATLSLNFKMCLYFFFFADIYERARIYKNYNRWGRYYRSFNCFFLSWNFRQLI